MEGLGRCGLAAICMPLLCFVDDEHTATGLEGNHSILGLAMYSCAKRSCVPEAHRPSNPLTARRSTAARSANNHLDLLPRRSVPTEKPMGEATRGLMSVTVRE